MKKRLPKHLRALTSEALTRMQTGFARFRYGFAEPGERIFNAIYVGNFSKKKDADAAAKEHPFPRINAYLNGALARGWSVWRGARVSEGVMSEPDCKNSPTGMHEGYWINKGVNFRCYHCQFQFYLADLPPDVMNRCKAEPWIAT